MDSHAVVRNNTEQCCIFYTQFSLMLTSCKTIVQYHNQDIDIDGVKAQDTEDSYPGKNPSC